MALTKSAIVQTVPRTPGDVRDSGLLLEVIPGPDLNTIPYEGQDQELIDSSNNEVMDMVSGYLDEDDISIGRMPVGGDMDISEFDQIPRNRSEMFPNDSEGAAGDELDLMAGDDGDDDLDGRSLDARESDDIFAAEDEEVDAFAQPALEQFPVFKSALRRHQAAEVQPRIVRVDTPESHTEFVCEKAVKEIDRRTHELRAALEHHLDEHESEQHPGFKKQRVAMRKWDEIVGAVKAIADLHGAESAAEAEDKMPQVPVDVPPFAEGSVKCWRDGDLVICSLKFMTSGGGRIATMAAKPRVSADDIEGWAMRSGVNPVTILGVLPDLAAVACGKRLVKDVAGAALKLSEREDVCGMDDSDEALLLVSKGKEGRAPVAALMDVQQRADNGDRQAVREMSAIRSVARTSIGRQIAAPILAEADEKLDRGRRLQGGDGESFMSKYVLMGACL